jgi:predicted nucleic acid-binding protein
MIQPEQRPDWRAITIEFFRIVAEKTDEYELFISPVTIDETSKAEITEDKRKASATFLETIHYTELPQHREAENLARIYAADGVLSQAKINDLRHVAYAVAARCDYVVSWNMKHLANDRTEMRVNAVNAKEYYTKISIVTPEHFTKGGSYGQQ